MSLYSIAADLFEFTDRIERSRSVDESTARASTARDSPHREPQTKGDLELPNIFPGKENPTERAPTLDILADCLEYVHQVQIRTFECFLGRVIGIQYLQDDCVRSYKHSLCSGTSCFKNLNCVWNSPKFAAGSTSLLLVTHNDQGDIHRGQCYVRH